MFEITISIYSNSERLVQFLKQNTILHTYLILTSCAWAIQQGILTISYENSSWNKIIGVQKNAEKLRKNTFMRSCGDILYNLRSLVSRSMQQRNSILASVLSEYLLLLTRYFAHLSMASNLKICRRKKNPQNARLWFDVENLCYFLLKQIFINFQKMLKHTFLTYQKRIFLNM